MDNQTKDQIRDAVAKAKLDKALQMFGTWAETHGDKDIQNTIFVKTSEFNGLKRDENLGVIGGSDANIRRNRIAAAILSLLDDAADNGSVTNSKTSEETPNHINNNINSNPNPNIANNGTILFLAANPSDTAKLQLDREFAQVFKNIGDNRITYKLEAEFAVTASLLQTALLKYRPRIVHFSGHGLGGTSATSDVTGTRAVGKMPSSQAGIVLQTLDGKSQLVSGVALASLFKTCMKIFKLEVVVLNACSSEEQASAIFNAGVPFVIGMNAAVKDSAAIQFSAKFYEGLASQGNVEIAFELAVSGVMMENGFSNDAEIPVLHKKPV
jgi:hypothetical protein